MFTEVVIVNGTSAAAFKGFGYCLTQNTMSTDLHFVNLHGLKMIAKTSLKVLLAVLLF